MYVYLEMSKKYLKIDLQYNLMIESGSELILTDPDPFWFLHKIAMSILG